MKENLFSPLKYMALFSITLTGMESDLKSVICGAFPAIQSALFNAKKGSQNPQNTNENQEAFYTYIETAYNLLPKGKVDKTHGVAKQIVNKSIPSIKHLHTNIKEKYLLFATGASTIEFWTNTKKNAYSFLSSEVTTAIQPLFNIKYYAQILSQQFLKASDLQSANEIYNNMSIEDIEYLNKDDKYSGLPYFSNLYGNVITTAPGFVVANTMTPEEFETLRLQYAQKILPQINKSYSKKTTEFNVMDMYMDMVSFFQQNCENYKKYYGVFPVYFFDDIKNEGNYNEFRVIFANFTLLETILNNYDNIMKLPEQKREVIFNIYDQLNIPNSPLIFTNTFSLDVLNFDRVGKNNSSEIFALLKKCLNVKDPKYEEYNLNLDMLSDINKTCISKGEIYNNRQKFSIVNTEMSSTNYSTRNSI